MKKMVAAALYGVFSLAAAYAQKPIVPIVELKFGGLIGGVQNGKWVPSAKTAQLMTAKTEFLLVGWNGVEEGGVAWGEKGEMEVCEDFQRMNFDLRMDHGVAIGTAAKWNFSPRRPAAIALNNSVYRTAVADFLKTKGLVRPVVAITQAYRIDLEGDGVDEVLISAEYAKKDFVSEPAPGEYSFVLLRKTNGKNVVNHLLAGDFITKSNAAEATPSVHAISGVADLNGDGKLEIVLHGNYYEGDFSKSFEMKAGKPVEIAEFSIECGV